MRVGRLDVLREHEHADAGCSARIRWAATRPSSVWVGGIRMSTIATSGSRDGAPGAAGLGVARPGRRPRCPASSSSRTMPSRVSIVSSATTTRMGSPREATPAATSILPPSAPTRSASVDRRRRRRPVDASTISVSPSRRTVTLDVVAVAARRPRSRRRPRGRRHARRRPGSRSSGSSVISTGTGAWSASVRSAGPRPPR